MAYYKGYKKGGSGGKLGHSNMSHWDTSGSIKWHARKSRRIEERELEQSVLETYSDPETNIASLDDELNSIPETKKPAKSKKAQAFTGYMSAEKLDEWLNLLRKEKVRFFYFRDYYAFLLLMYNIGEAGMEIREIKRSSFARLLDRPQIKTICQTLGDGKLNRDVLMYNIPLAQECFMLTLDEWGQEKQPWSTGYYQTSRPGKNLVIQLNFSNQHDKYYRQLIRPTGSHPFEYENHPISKGKYRTLAWARIDLADDLSYALIEEIQTDWIRLANSYKTTIETIETDEQGEQRLAQASHQSRKTDEERLQKYVDAVLKPYTAIWDEAILSASIWFLKEEMGVNKIFYHTFEGGNLLKGIDMIKKPPKSLYTKLPGKFCFSITDEAPEFINAKVKEIENKEKTSIKFYLLNL